MYKKKPKFINVDLSLQYYLKGQEFYKPRDCHKNVYNYLTDVSYDEMLGNRNDFILVTGLLVYEKNDEKYCYIHSWAEIEKNVIDVTAFANTSLSLETKNDLILNEKIRSILGKQMYFGCSKINGTEFINKMNKIAKLNDESLILNAFNEYLNSIIKKVENNTCFVESICKDYDCVFKDDDFVNFIDI